MKCEIKLQKIVANLLDELDPICVREWNGDLEIFGRPQVIENYWQYLLLQKDILQKAVVGFLYLCLKKNFFGPLGLRLV